MDNDKIYFGTSQDSSIYYDGNNLYVNPAEVGDGKFIIDGGFEVFENATFGLNTLNTTIIDDEGKIYFKGSARPKKRVANIYQLGSGTSTHQNYMRVRALDDTLNEYMVWNGFIPLDFDSSVTPQLIVHGWATNTQTGNKTIRFRLINNKATVGSVVPSWDTSYHNFNMDENLLANEVVEFVFNISDATAGDSVSFYLRREGASGDDTLVGDFEINYVSYFEYTSNKLGEYT